MSSARALTPPFETCLVMDESLAPAFLLRIVRLRRPQPHPPLRVGLASHLASRLVPNSAMGQPMPRPGVVSELVG